MSWTCSPIPAARGCTSAIRKATRPPISSAATAACRGYSVMHPMGWDAFGLPAEQHAKKTGTHPRTTTESNINNFRRQLKMLGFSYDWDRELATTDVDLLPLDAVHLPGDLRYLVRRRTAKRPADRRTADPRRSSRTRRRRGRALSRRTPPGLSDRGPGQLVPRAGHRAGQRRSHRRAERRGGHPVVRMPLRQWMLRITAYADRLENDLDGLDWSESIKALQRNWIGRSTRRGGRFLHRQRESTRTASLGSEEYEGWRRTREASGFPSKPDEQVLRIYTTRPDTLFGATYMVIAPEHPFVERLTTPERAEAVQAYCEKAARKSDLDRTDLAKEKTGVFTGSYAINPVTGKPIPDLGRRLRPHQLRHRGDHGSARARRAGF